MRFLRVNQLWLEASSPESPAEKNPIILELEKMSEILDECPEMIEVYSQVKRDLVGERRADCGATGLSAEQALRAALVKEKLGLSYRDLEFYLVDSVTLRSFVRLEPTKRVSKSVLNRDIRLMSEETWKLFNECMKRYAEEKKIENGLQVRGDTTATETNIHHPTDATLLCDCIRVLTRLMIQAEEILPGLTLKFSVHNRRARRRLYKINNAKNEYERYEEYRDLIKVCGWTRDYAHAAFPEIESFPASDVLGATKKLILLQELKHYLDLCGEVLSQSIRRVLKGEEVPALEKVVSIFEPHSDIIEKGGRDTVFGHKICLTSGRSGLILDCITLEGNPPDSSLVDIIIKRHQDSYGRVPEQIAFDGGFASLENATIAKAHGVKDVAFSKTKGIEILSLTRSEKVFKALTHFRAGIEAGISALKRSYGFTRVLAKGWRAFKTSLLNGVAAFNLTLLARHQLQQT